MWYLTEAAEWFERQRNESNGLLDSWVENSGYSIGSMATASTTKAVMALGAGFVDLLRIGDGVKEGSLKGAGVDALRVLAVFPVGKTLGLLKTARGVVPAKFIIDTGGPNCFWVASAKALRQLGHSYKGRLLVGVDELASALGMPMNSLAVIPNLSVGMTLLKQLGARVGVIYKITSVKDIVRILPRDGSVLMLAVHVMKGRRVIGGHAIYAFRNALGQVRYMDRTVGTKFASATQGVFKSVDEIAPLYGASAIIPYEAAVLQNVFARSVAHEVPRLFIPALGVIAEDR
jgi:hypothetical protein